MNIRDFLSQANVVIDAPARDKMSVLDDVARRAASALKLSADAVADEIKKRDELGSTGIGHGVCLPHARLREIDKPFALLARLKHPIGFDAVDGEPVDIVFLLLLPASSQLDQLNALAAVARKLRDPDILRRLRSASSKTELHRALTEG